MNENGCPKFATAGATYPKDSSEARCDRGRIIFREVYAPNDRSAASKEERACDGQPLRKSAAEADQNRGAAGRAIDRQVLNSAAVLDRQTDTAYQRTSGYVRQEIFLQMKRSWLCI
jgi:hypothetical protein